MALRSKGQQPGEEDGPTALRNMETRDMWKGNRDLRGWAFGPNADLGG